MNSGHLENRITVGNVTGSRLVGMDYKSQGLVMINMGNLALGASSRHQMNVNNYRGGLREV